MPKIYQIDDLLDRCTVMTNAITEAGDNFFEAFAFLHCKSEEQYKAAATVLQKDNSDKIVFLDLGFRDELNAEDMWASVSDNLTALAASTGKGNCCLSWVPSNSSEGTTSYLQLSASSAQNELQAVRKITDNRLDGISLLGSIGGTASNSKVLVIVVTQLAPRDLTHFLAAIQQGFIEKGWSNFRVEKDPDGRDPQTLADAKSLLTYAKTRWTALFPSLHEMSAVETVLAAWLEEYDELALDQRSHFCTHGNASITYTIDGSPDYYRHLVQKLFGIDRAVANSASNNDLKALLQLEREPARITPENAFPVGDSSPGTGDKSISRNLTVAILNKICGAQVRFAGGESFRLPCQPALPFLLSLVVLFDRMRSQDGGMLSTSTPILLTGSMNGPNRISIPLREREDFKGRMGARWLEKVKDFSGSIANDTKGGVCPALWDVLVSRVHGIQTESQIEPEKKNLLRLFEGPGRLVAGVSFGPFYIHIHW